MLEKMSKSKGVAQMAKKLGTTKLNSGEYDIMKPFEGMLSDDNSTQKRSGQCSFMDVLKIYSAKD
jgi:hypothetical protein